VRLLIAACGTARGDVPARRSCAVRVVTFLRWGAALVFGAVRATEIERAIRSLPRREDVLTYCADSFLVRQMMASMPL
jgi:short subunit fatty acids transporter